MANPGFLASLFGRVKRGVSLAGAGGIHSNEYAVPYFDHIISVYVNTEYDRADPRDVEIRDFIESVRTKRLDKNHTLTFSEVFSVERAILRLQGLDTLRARASGLRNQYRALYGEEEWAVYLKSAHEPELATAPQLRSDLLLLLDGFHWKYTFGPIREKALDDVNWKLLRVMAGFFLIALLTVGYDFMHWGQSHQTVSLIPLVVFAGATGASISLQNRLSRVPTTGDSIISLFALKHGGSTLLLSPLSGALFALCAYLLFISGLVKGDMFPKMRIAETAEHLHQFRSFGAFLHSMSPVDSINFAKLLLFCFVAGFAERLIPDALDRLVEKNVNSLTTQMLTADSLKDTLTGFANKANRDAKDKATAEAEETKKQKEAEEKAAKDKADAEQEATRTKEKIEKEAAEAKTNADDRRKEEIEKQAATDKAAAENEATRKKQEADLQAAESKAAASKEATQKKQEVDEQGLGAPTEPPLVKPTLPPLEPQQPPEPTGQPSPSPEEPKNP